MRCPKWHSPTRIPFANVWGYAIWIYGTATANGPSNSTFGIAIAFHAYFMPQNRISNPGAPLPNDTNNI